MVLLHCAQIYNLLMPPSANKSLNANANNAPYAKSSICNMVFSLFKFLEINLQTSFRNLIFPPDFLHLIYLPSFFHLLFTNFLYLFHFIISFPPYTPHFLTVLYEMCWVNESVFKGVSKKKWQHWSGWNEIERIKNLYSTFSYLFPFYLCDDVILSNDTIIASCALLFEKYRNQYLFFHY